MDQIDWDIIIKKDFGFLLDTGEFKITSDIYSSEMFGNRRTTLESNEHNVILLLDRSDFLIKVSSKARPELEKEITILIAYIRDEPSYIKDNFPKNEQKRNTERQINFFTSIFKQYHQEVFDLFKEDRIEGFLEDFDKFRLRLRKLRKPR